MKKIFNCLQLVALCLTVAIVLHYTKVMEINAGKPVMWIVADAALIYILICWWHKQFRGKGGRKQREERTRRKHIPPQPAKEKDRTPFNTHLPKSDKPVWRNIPGHATLLLDTNVLMCPDDIIRSWFGYILHNAKKRSWKVVVHGAVYEEIIAHLKGSNPGKAKDARLARNRIEVLMDQLGTNMEGPEMQLAAVKPKTASYADPKLIEYMLTHKRTFLFSFDNDLKIRCKLLIRDKQPSNRVFSEEDFYA